MIKQTTKQVNSNVTVTEITPIDSNKALQVARLAVGSSIASRYGSYRVYAAALSDAMGGAWFEVKHDAKDHPLFAAVKAEKKSLYEVLYAANDKNPSATYNDIREYGLQHAQANKLFGYVPVAKNPEGHVDEEGEGEGEGNDSAKLTPEARIYKMLGDVLNKVQKLEGAGFDVVEMTKRIQACQGMITL